MRRGKKKEVERAKKERTEWIRRRVKSDSLLQAFKGRGQDIKVDTRWVNTHVYDWGGRADRAGEIPNWPGAEKQEYRTNVRTISTILTTNPDPLSGNGRIGIGKENAELRRGLGRSERLLDKARETRGYLGGHPGRNTRSAAVRNKTSARPLGREREKEREA